MTGVGVFPGSTVSESKGDNSVTSNTRRTATSYARFLITLLWAVSTFCFVLDLFDVGVDLDLPLQLLACQLVALLS